ncbi:MAG TPA: hypothetical protein VM308_01365 [Sphingomicrobium sp.]|nr:hypothetical protein [Sphingomicrobium sp.]
MRLIVSLLKLFVGTAFLICTIGLAFILGASLIGFSDDRLALFGGLGVYAAVVGFIVLVLYVGVVALLISGHDRLSEIAALLAERNELLRNSPRAD